MTWPFLTPLVEWARVRVADMPTHRVEPGAPPATMDILACRALEVARTELEAGCGEFGGNNCGPDVVRYCGREGVSWCAGFAGYCYAQAAEMLNVDLPFRRSLGAKRLGANIAAVGRRFSDPVLAKPGDLMVFDRGPTGSWLGHVAIVEDVSLGVCHTIEGNCGPKIMRRSRLAVARDRFVFFATLRR